MTTGPVELLRSETFRNNEDRFVDESVSERQPEKRCLLPRHFPLRRSAGDPLLNGSILDSGAE
jgi:hypothetical protein